MTALDKLVALKRKVSPELLRVPGVTGVGLPGNRLTVYLREDKPEIRQTVEKILAEYGERIEVSWAVTGEFQRR